MSNVYKKRNIWQAKDELYIGWAAHYGITGLVACVHNLASPKFNLNPRLGS